MEIINWLTGLSKEVFIKDYLERQCLLVSRNEEDYYGGILSLKDIDEMLAFEKFSKYDLRVTQINQEIDDFSYLNKRMEYDGSINYEVEMQSVYDLYNNGGTIIIEEIDKKQKSVFKCVKDIEDALSVKVQANLYLTPPSSQGFPAHYDTHDVFILQTVGKKIWRVYSNPVELPSQDNKYNEKLHSNIDLLYEVELKQGDFLYIPRGFVHEAKTSVTTSGHLTIGLYMLTYLECAFKTLKEKSEELGLNESVNRAYLLNSITNKEIQFQIQASDIKKNFNEFLNKRVPVLDNFLLSSGREISPEMMFSIRNSTSLIKRKEGVDIRYFNKLMTFPVNFSPVLEYILKTGTFNVEMLSGFMDAKTSENFIKRLIKEGIVYVEK